MSKIINFRARSKTEFDTHLKPYPAAQNLPKWFTEMEPYSKGGMFPDDGKIHLRSRQLNATPKKCVPMLDGMTAGYIIPLWSDVMVEINNGIYEIYWKTHKDILQPHGTRHDMITPPAGYDNVVFKYLNCWIPQTPPGYSCLVVSPLGHKNLPFEAIPAVVDTDKSTLELIFPMWIKKDLQGIVEKGTPMVQIIPFKRDNWESTFDYYEDGEYYSVVEEKNFNTTIVNHYIKNHWSKKKYK